MANSPILMTIQNMNGVVRGLNFTYASSCPGVSSVITNSSSNVLFDTVNFIWNGGQGVAANYPSAEITSLGFGSEPTGFSTSPHTVTLTNTGKSSVNINSIVPTSAFTEANTCGKSVAAGKSCMISITFKPTQVQDDTGSLVVTDSDGSSLQTISVTGTGTGSPKVQFSVHSLAFGGLVYKTPSSGKIVTVTDVGTAPLAISALNFTGTNASDFTASSCSQEVPVNVGCNITAVMTPTIVGKISGTFSLVDNASSSPQTLNVSGNGLTAIKLIPNSINLVTVTLHNPQY